MTSFAEAQARALFEKGLALHRSGQLADAQAQYEQVLKLLPRHFDATQLLGMIAGQTRNYRQAADYFARAAAIDGADPSLHNNLGFALRETGRHEAAIASFDRAIALKPDYAKAHNNRGMALAALGQFEAALAGYDRAAALDPRYAEAFNNRGFALANLKRFDAAIASFDKAIGLHPGYAEAWSNRGNAMADMGRPQDAVVSYDKAIVLNPNYTDAHGNRGLALAEMDRPGDAIAAYDRALAIDPKYAEAHCNRGVALMELKQPQDALASFDRALALRPDYVIALQNRGLTLLCLGQYAEGWPLFEWRDRESAMAGRDFLSKPLWLGDAPLRGKTILIHFERGLGDTIQFCRYLPLLEQLGAHVLFAPQKPLTGLMATLGSGIRIVDIDAPLPDIDYHCPIFSLPLAFLPQRQSIPAAAPYLAAEPDRVVAWQERLGDRGFKVGICWQGEPRKNDKGRSFPLAEFKSLAGIAGVRLISLHKGSGEAQLAGLPDGVTVESLGGDLDTDGAFLDTAAVMMQCDLIITSDTSIAHLAGALGRPVWVVLKHVPDWRWMLDRDDSPWYPSMRLFRQGAPGDWAGAFGQVQVALKAVMGKA